MSNIDPRRMIRQVAEFEFPEDDSSHDDNTSSADEFGGEGAEEPPPIAEKEFSAKDAARATNCVGYVVLCLLVFLGSILSILTHFYVQGSEEQEFVKGVRDGKLALDPHVRTLYRLRTLILLF